MSDDTVNHPSHYTVTPLASSASNSLRPWTSAQATLSSTSGGSWEKGGIEDLLKALWYVRREIDFRSSDHKGLGELRQPLSCHGP
jgi:hypothetical protein